LSSMCFNMETASWSRTSFFGHMRAHDFPLRVPTHEAGHLPRGSCHAHAVAITILKHTAEFNRLLRRLTRRSVPTRRVNSSTFADLLSLTDQRMCFNMVTALTTLLAHGQVLPVALGSPFGYCYHIEAHCPCPQSESNGLSQHKEMPSAPRRCYLRQYASIWSCRPSSRTVMIPATSRWSSPGTSSTPCSYHIEAHYVPESNRIHQLYRSGLPITAIARDNCYLYTLALPLC